MIQYTIEDRRGQQVGLRQYSAPQLPTKGDVITLEDDSEWQFAYVDWRASGKTMHPVVVVVLQKAAPEGAGLEEGE